MILELTFVFVRVPEWSILSSLLVAFQLLDDRVKRQDSLTLTLLL